MRIITAFDSFKGCMSAKEACFAAAKGIHQVHPDAEVVCLPISDGGEGMVECISEALGLEPVTIEVTGPLGTPVLAHYSIDTTSCSTEPFTVLKTAYMEMASASGLTLVPPEKRNPTITTTRGVGEMISDAIQRGCQKIIMGIGGSATCDGGAGMIEYLMPHLPLPVEIIVASDVSNPLFGSEGAAYVFAPQKGATPDQVIQLDNRLRQFAKDTEAAGIADASLAYAPGAGAAGGLGYGLMAYLKAKLVSGIDLVLDTIQFDAHLSTADLVITGEGKTDGQTLYTSATKGNIQPKKVPMGVLARAKGHHVRTILLSGAIEDHEQLLDAGFAEVRSINEADNRPQEVLLQKETAMANLQQTCQHIF